MKTEYIDVKKKWGIVVCYDLMRKDVHEMRALMESVGMEDDEIDGYLRLLLYHKNKGVCISNMGLAMSLVFIGEADSEDQWWDTLAHEILDHAKIAILPCAAQERGQRLADRLPDAQGGATYCPALRVVKAQYRDHNHRLLSLLPIHTPLLWL